MLVYFDNAVFDSIEFEMLESLHSLDLEFSFDNSEGITDELANAR